jgi:hypothetical protein
MFGWWLVRSVIISKNNYCPYIILGSISLSGTFFFWASVAFRGLYWCTKWQWIDEEFEGSEDVMGWGKGEKKTKRKTAEIGKEKCNVKSHVNSQSWKRVCQNIW